MARRIQAAEAAELMGCSPRLVQKLCQNRHLPAVKVGAIWTTTVAAVNDYLNRPAGAICPKRTSIVAVRPTMLGSRSAATTYAEAYTRLIPGLPSSGSAKSCRKPRTGARA